jgi:hypothetical protein
VRSRGGKLAGTGRPERQSPGESEKRIGVGATREAESGRVREKDWGWGDDVRSQGGSDGQATADGVRSQGRRRQELDSS